MKADLNRNSDEIYDDQGKVRPPANFKPPYPEGKNVTIHEEDGSFRQTNTRRIDELKRQCQLGLVSVESSITGQLGIPRNIPCQW